LCWSLPGAGLRASCRRLGCSCCGRWGLCHLRRLEPHAQKKYNC
jgi:hypothetical protein